MPLRLKRRPVALVLRCRESSLTLKRATGICEGLTVIANQSPQQGDG